MEKHININLKLLLSKISLKLRKVEKGLTFGYCKVCQHKVGFYKIKLNVTNSKNTSKKQILAFVENSESFYEE